LIMPSLKSTVFHLRPAISPNLMPVKNATVKKLQYLELTLLTKEQPDLIHG
jgi:hypothetical protein